MPGVWGSFLGAWGLIEGRFRADIEVRPYMGVDSKKLEYGLGTIFAVFLASTVI